MRKLGLTFGASMTASSMVSASIQESAKEIKISQEQAEFMEVYEEWMDEFIEVIKIQKRDPENHDNNRNIVKLSEQAKAWQTQLEGYMKEDNFARYYMVATERMTLEI